ncbi:hypothetical protein SUGI_0952310, partial [Cryptomeria japonica]
MKKALLLLGLFAFTGYSLYVPRLLGIDPNEKEYFQSTRIMCKDGSKTFPRDRLNDNFCDCTDGTDEPGTSACPEGKFYCTNTGHAPIQLFSSRVNDGICDCCDGSDEYSGKIGCPNTCTKAGMAFDGKLIDKLSAYSDSSIMKKRNREHIRQKLLSEEDDLVSLNQDDKEIQGLIQKLKELKVLPLLELVLVASILFYSQSGCCRRRRVHLRRR